MAIDHWSLSQQTQSLLWLIQNSDFFTQKENYDILIMILNDHNHLYYIDNNPLISDHDYDTLFNTLKEFESLHPELIRDDSPTQKLIEQYDIQSSFKKSHHLIPILSLQNTYNTQDIIDRYESISTMLRKKIENSDQYNDRDTDNDHLLFSIEPKYDGLSIVITYEWGKLAKAVTRGDGYTGDDVTANIKTIRNLPHTISEKQRVVVRGEVMMPKSTRKKINILREENNEEPFSNTRNAAAGSLKLLDTNEVAKRWLICYIYDILQGPLSSLQEFENLNSIMPFRQGATLSEITTYLSDTTHQTKLQQADVDFDGLVIKLQDNDLRTLLWETNHHPRRAIAYKFPAQQIATQIEKIERQVWRTGILTPVAHLTPTALSGVTISRVSLHNLDFIRNKGIKLYDRVRLQRSGEVIPYIVSVITQRRDETQKDINPDSIQCPACSSHAQIVENVVGTKSNPTTTTQLYCPNHDCPGILKEKLKHFVSKNAMNIASIGESILDLLVDQSLLHSLSDIYTLTQPETIFLLKRFPGIGTKKVDTFIDEIIASKTNPLWRFINALGISGIGIKLAKEIEKHLHYRPNPTHTIDQMFEAITTTEFLESIYGVGEKLIIELQEWYINPINKTLLSNFDRYGINPTLPNTSTTSSTQKKSICITGTFPLTRSEMEFSINQSGFQFTPNLTKTTDYLFVGDNAGSKKDKAWPHTKVLDNIQEIYSLLGISAPLFEEKKESEKPSWGEMQSLFG